MRIRLVILCLVVLTVSSPAFAQTGPLVVDRALDEYETLLKEAIDLKRRSSSGESVLQYELYSLATRLSAIRKSLASGAEMSEVQKDRMNALLRWYNVAENGFEGQVLWVSPRRFDNQARAVINDDKPWVVSPAALIKKNPYRWHPFAEVCAGGFDTAIPCLRAGLVRKSFGGYLSGFLMKGKHLADYECLSDGSIPSGGAIYTSGAKVIHHFGVSAGGLLLPIRLGGIDDGRAGLYLGGGYGQRELLWQDIESKWARVADRSWAGMEMEGGIIILYKKWCASVGMRTTCFAHADFEAGIGLRF